ncbi:MAG: ATP-binding protein [Alcanivoracaceae bacterium]|nr:ATP-binding protein [Alcanivoracaceae bacterium]
MNSIFLRIYGGMMLAVLLVGLLAYAGVTVVNSYRADVYRESMARGTFYLMARGVQRQQDAAALERWLQVLGRLMGSPVQIRTPEEAALSDDELARLADGRVVMQLNEAGGYADIYFQLPGDARFLYTRMTRVSEQQARATALLVLDEISNFAPEQWNEELARIQQHFGFTIDRIPFNELKLDREQLQRLSRREVVTAIEERTRGQPSGVVVYAPIGSTGDVLVLGPMSLFEYYPVEMMVFVGALGLVAMGFAAYLLVRPLQLRLLRLGRAVERLGAGDLNAKADVSSQDAVGQLAATFNGMTDHIRRLIQSQREMTRAVSHELRTPVARLRFGLEMLEDVEDMKERRRRLDELDNDIDQLDDLIDEILTFARLEEGAPSIEFDDLDAPDLLNRLRDELLPLSGDISLEVDRSLDALPPEYRRCQGAERYLHRIVQNLATNALRYARSRVVMRYRVDGDLAVIEVDDDGPGIPENDRSRVFKPFARLDESRHRKSGGYGLGLSIVQRIAEWHGGQVDIETSPMGGARFRLVWPRRRAVPGHVLVSGQLEHPSVP